MSLIYLKSNRFIKDINSRRIPESGELPYQFNAQFKEPINITPQSKIELISADLNIDSVHEINEDRLNDSFVFGFGKESQIPTLYLESFQTPIKLNDGRYSNELLANEITRSYDNANLYDNLRLDLKFNSRLDKFEGKFEMEDLNINNNNYGLIAEKMGYQESDINLATGVGTRTSQTVYITNKISQTNFQDNGFDLTDANISSGGTPSNNLLPVNLLSNLGTTFKGQGISNFDGIVSSVITPTKMRVFPEDWSTEFTGNFRVIVNGINTACTFGTGTGAGYDFKIVGINQGKYEGKLIYNKTQWNTSPRPDIGFTYDSGNNIEMSKLPYGQLLIINDHTVLNSPSTVLKNNQIVLVYREQQAGNGWQLFYSSPGLNINQFTIEDNEILDFYTESQVVSMGFYSGGIALTRGETALTGTNQMNSINKFTRTRVENIASSFLNVQVDSKIYADYALQICPYKNRDNDSVVIMRYGTQDVNKVAGETDWLNVPDCSSGNSSDLSDILDNLDSDKDNIILVAQMLDYRNVKFLIGHDTSGNGEFINFTLLSSTNLPDTDNRHLPINFNQASYPIMPVIAPGNGYISLGQEAKVIGKYSKFKAELKNLQTVRQRVNNEFGKDFNIPVRQLKSNIDSFGDLDDFVQSSFINLQNKFDEPIEEPEGTTLQGDGESTVVFNDSTTDIILFIGDDDVIKTYENTSDSPFSIRFGQATEADEEELTKNSLDVEPDLETRLNKNLGYNETTILQKVGILFPDGPAYTSNLNSNYIVNIENLGNLKGQNSGTKTISRMVGVIPSAELQNDENSGTKHYVSQYPNPVAINAKTNEKINNFMVNITDDENYPAQDLRHPTNLLVKISE